MECGMSSLNNDARIGVDVTCSESSSFNDMSTSENENDNEQIETPLVVTKEQDRLEPKIGMMFSNETEAYQFYNKYAKSTGFSVRKNQYRRLANGTIRQRTFVCAKEGHRKPKDPSHVKKKNRGETRTGCPAIICFNIEKNAWVVSKFIYDHNHDLVNDSATTMLRSHRNVDETHGNMIEDMDKASIKPSCIYSYFVEVAGGAQNVGFLKSDCDNFLQSKRSNTLEAGDAQSVINHFKTLQANDPSFFYTYLAALTIVQKTPHVGIFRPLFATAIYSMGCSSLLKFRNNVACNITTAIRSLMSSQDVYKWLMPNDS